MRKIFVLMLLVFLGFGQPMRAMEPEAIEITEEDRSLGHALLSVSEERMGLTRNNEIFVLILSFVDQPTKCNFSLANRLMKELVLQSSQTCPLNYDFSKDYIYYNDLTALGGKPYKLIKDEFYLDNKSREALYSLTPSVLLIDMMINIHEKESDKKHIRFPSREAVYPHGWKTFLDFLDILKVNLTISSFCFQISFHDRIPYRRIYALLLKSTELYKNLTAFRFYNSSITNGYDSDTCVLDRIELLKNFPNLKKLSLKNCTICESYPRARNLCESCPRAEDLEKAYHIRSTLYTYEALPKNLDVLDLQGTKPGCDSSKFARMVTTILKPKALIISSSIIDKDAFKLPKDVTLRKKAYSLVHGRKDDAEVPNCHFEEWIIRLTETFKDEADIWIQPNGWDSLRTENLEAIKNSGIKVIIIEDNQRVSEKEIEVEGE